SGSFPECRRIQINRIETKGNKTKDSNVDVDTILKSGECSHDVWLEWGDLVDSPEHDHPITEQWVGLPSDISDALRKCLERNITIVIKGESTMIKLVPNPRTALRMAVRAPGTLAPLAGEGTPPPKRTSLASRLLETIY